METRTKYLKLPFYFDEKKLLEELSKIYNNNWISHFNTAGYNGDWKAISLYAVDGDEANIFALSNANSELKETSILKRCIYFKEIIDSFKSKVLSARLLRLCSGAEIKPHRDYDLGYENNNFRLHIPITTNNAVQFILDDENIKMLPGECWYTNVNYIHSVYNRGQSDRVHLVVDFERNNWSDKLFFSLANQESFDPPAKKGESPEEIKMIIEQLKFVDAPETKKLIADLELKLSKLKNNQ